MKNKLAFIVTLSLLLTSISPVNAIGAEVIEAAEEENPSVYFQRMRRIRSLRSWKIRRPYPKQI